MKTKINYLSLFMFLLIFINLNNSQILAQEHPSDGVCLNSINQDDFKSSFKLWVEEKINNSIIKPYLLAEEPSSDIRIEDIENYVIESFNMTELVNLYGEKPEKYESVIKSEIKSILKKNTKRFLDKISENQIFVAKEMRIKIKPQDPKEISLDNALDTGEAKWGYEDINYIFVKGIIQNESSGEEEISLSYKFVFPEPEKSFCTTTKFSSENNFSDKGSISDLTLHFLILDMSLSSNIRSQAKQNNR